MMVDAALAYAAHGIPVLPVHTPARGGGGCSCGRAGCDRPGKHPRLRHGLIEASTDPRTVARWWERWPEANIGLRTGIAMDVADIDSTAGWHGLRHLLGGSVPWGPLARTGSGWHFWFEPLGRGNRVRVVPGLDWRGVGGYVVAPPSLHANGTAYSWVVRHDAALPQAPRALTLLIDHPAQRAPGHGTGGAGHGPGSAGHGPGAAGRERGAGASAESGVTVVHPERYAATALAAESNRVAYAPVGTRNDTLNRAAFALGRLIGAGVLDTATATRELTAAAAWAGLGRVETVRTIRSGLEAGRRAPLDIRTPSRQPGIRPPARKRAS